MGFVMLGLVAYNEIGLTGAVLQMFSHGVIAGLLFGVVGRMVYDRTHTRDFGALEIMGLSKKIPFAGVTFVIAGMASMGMPGFSGFVAELQVLIGAWHASPTLAVLAGLGIVIGVAYTLRAIQKGFFNESPVIDTAHGHGEMEPISVPERVGASMLLFATIAVGLYPRLLLDLIVPSFNSPLFEGLRKGGLL
jgi:NADH-quinone oxidoreductase subunit M